MPPFAFQHLYSNIKNNLLNKLFSLPFLLSFLTGRSFADSEGDDPSRVGGPADQFADHGDQFTTVISFKDGNTGAARVLQQAASRLAKAEHSGGRNLQDAFRLIGSMCDTITLPKSIVDTSKQLFKRVDEERLLKGKKVEAIIAACIFIACRQGRVPRTFKEIVKLTDVPKKVHIHIPLITPVSLTSSKPNRTLAHASKLSKERLKPPSFPFPRLVQPTPSSNVTATISVFPCQYSRLQLSL